MTEEDFEMEDFTENEESEVLGFLEKPKGRKSRMERSAKIRKRRNHIKERLEREHASGFRGAYDFECN